MVGLNWNAVEQIALEWLRSFDCTCAHGLDAAPGTQKYRLWHPITNKPKAYFQVVKTDLTSVAGER